MLDDESDAELADEANEVGVDLVVVYRDGGFVFVLDTKLVEDLGDLALGLGPEDDAFVGVRAEDRLRVRAGDEAVEEFRRDDGVFGGAQDREVKVRDRELVGAFPKVLPFRQFGGCGFAHGKDAGEVLALGTPRGILMLLFLFISKAITKHNSSVEISFNFANDASFIHYF